MDIDTALKFYTPIKDAAIAQQIIDLGGRAQGWAPGPHGRVLRVDPRQHLLRDGSHFVAAVRALDENHFNEHPI